MKKRLTMVILLVLALVAACAVAFAEESAPPQDEISKNPDFSMVEWRQVLRSDEFSVIMGLASLDKRSSTSVYIYGYTEANQKASTVGGTVTLQQWKSNQWNNYYKINFNAYDSLSASGSGVVTVESGYYYRVVTTHKAMSYAGEQAPRKGMTTKSVYID